jgi:phosphoribosylformimino-5-aminoimidazole carboxamide ribotide isomerase
MAEAVECRVIASGGVSCIDDIIALKKTGVDGVIIGKAIYEGRLNLKEAITAIGGNQCSPKE